MMMMMNNVQITTNSDFFVRVFDKLTSKNQNKVFTNSLRKGVGTLTKQARKNLRKVVKNSTKVTIKGAFKGQKLSNGFRVKIWKKKQGATVHILKDARLKWIELGNKKERTTKKTRKIKPHSTGQMKPTYFFRDARNETEPQVFSNMQKIIMDEIIKQWKKQTNG